MAGRMRVCPDCRRYTLASKCPKDATATVSPHPAKFSPEDHYGTYRRRLKRLAGLERREG